MCLPMVMFSRRDTHFRISFAAADEALREGAEILARLRDKIDAGR